MSVNGGMLQINKISKDEFEVIGSGKSVLYKREELAEFLWVAAIFLDSEQRHYPKVDLVGCDY